MRFVSVAALVVATLVFGSGGPLEAETARLRFVAAAYADDKGAGLNMPEGLACGAKGQVVVGDTANDRLLRFTFLDQTVTGGSEIKTPELSAPSRVQLTSKGEILALDGKRRRIARLSPEGTFKGALSFEGVPPPTTIVPKSFKLDSADNIYVLDAFSARVLVLNPDGTFRRQVALPSEAGFIADLTVDVSGNLLVVDAVRRRMFVSAKDADVFVPLGGDMTDTLATLPTYLTTSRGTILVVEGTGGSIVSFGLDGSFLSRQLAEGWKEGWLNHPAQICINEKDEVFVADRDNSRIQVFRLAR